MDSLILVRRWVSDPADPVSSESHKPLVPIEFIWIDSCPCYLVGLLAPLNYSFIHFRSQVFQSTHLGQCCWITTWTVLGFYSFIQTWYSWFHWIEWPHVLVLVTASIFILLLSVLQSIQVTVSYSCWQTPLEWWMTRSFTYDRYWSLGVAAVVVCRSPCHLLYSFWMPDGSN